jgi:hypothetical protein
MVYDARRMRAVLLGKLDAEEAPGSRHMRYKVFRGDTLIASTAMSHGADEIDAALAKLMARQLCISLGTLKKIYGCPFGWDEYLEHYDPAWNPNIPYRFPRECE